MKFKNYLTKDVKLITTLMKNHTIILMIIILSYVATYLLNVYLANLLNPRLYGDISIVFQILIFSLPFALLGTEMTMMHYLPKYFQEKSYDLAAGYLRWNTRVFIWATIIIFSLSFVVVFLSTIFEYLGFEKLLSHRTVIYSFWLIPLFSLTVLLATVLQTMRRFYAASAFRGCAVTLLIILNIFLFLSTFENTWIGAYRRPLSIVLCMALAYLVIIVVEIVMLLKRLPKEIYKAQPHYQNKRWFSHSLEMLGSFAGVTILAAFELILLEIFGSGEADVGHFAAILVIASSLMVFGLTVDMLVNPLISSYIHKNKVHLQSIIDVANIFKLGLAIVLSFTIIIFGPWLLSHFGKSFEGAYFQLLVLLLGYFIALCFRSATPLLLYSGHHMVNFKVSLTQFATLGILSAVLIPFFQLYGAVISFTIALGLFSIARTYFVRKFLDVRSFFFV